VSAAQDPRAVPWRVDPPGALLLSVRLQPGASRPGLAGVETDADGVARLRVRVGEPPEGGRANAALAALIAKSLRMGKSAVSLTAGHTSRNKTLRIEGDPGVLVERLTALLPPPSSSGP